MANDILCPACGHSLGFHSYDDYGCQAPLGGLTSHNKCECPMTIHVFILGLQKQLSVQEVEKLKNEKITIKNELSTLSVLLKDVSARNDELRFKLIKISEILKEAKLVEGNPFYGHFKINYKKEMHKLLDKALLEMEKNDESI